MRATSESSIASESLQLSSKSSVIVYQTQTDPIGFKKILNLKFF